MLTPKRRARILGRIEVEFRTCTGRFADLVRRPQKVGNGADRQPRKYRWLVSDNMWDGLL